jgi:PAS domain S-box-containing protein
MEERRNVKFRGLLEAAPDAILGVDADGRIVLVNAQAERLFGYSRDELIGEPVEILVPEGARADHPERRKSYLADPRTRPMGAGRELAGRRKDGSEFPAEISLSAIETEDGLLVAAGIRDVTERRLAAGAHAKLAAIVQSSHDAMIGKTLDGTITSWNPGAERLYGFTAAEILGRNVDVLIRPDRRGREAALLARIGRGERVEQFQTERVRKDGSLVSVSLTMSPIEDPTAGIVGVASVSRDMSDRQRSEAKFLGLLEAAPDAILGVDERGCIALVNAQAERLFGYHRDELIGQSVDILVPERVRAVHPQHRARYFADSRPRPMGAGMQLSARRKDGSEFPAEISLNALATEDGLLVSAAVRDVSERIEAQAEQERLKAQAERERLERRLQQSQRLESLGQLAGGVAHDFNNLLAVILNYTAFVADELAAPESSIPERREGMRQDLEQVVKAAERAARLTHQLLAFARREVARPEIISLNDVIAEVEQLLRRTIGEHVHLITSTAPDLPSVMADPGQIEQVLVNLAVNARDAMPGGGTLRIATDTFHIEEDDPLPDITLNPGDFVRLRVSDTGTGMDKEMAARAFEPFFTTKAKSEGSGLGLATAYGIITQAGGDIRIYSELGLGTTFNILLPVTRETGAARSALRRSRHIGGGETILVVEDEDAIREVTRRILSRNGYNVLIASGGPEALTLARQSVVGVDLLLTDVVMPHMLGKEVAQQMQAIQPDLRVLYMSGYAQPVLASEGTLGVGVLLLEKPFSETMLLDKVREALAG